MEFNEKLQELRKHRGLTQEELAEQLFVSRTAVSKWESGRGYPSIDSLRAIPKFFSVTVDELISTDEILVVAEADNKSPFSSCAFARSLHFCSRFWSLIKSAIASVNSLIFAFLAIVKFKLPFSIQIHPGRTDKLRTGIFRTGNHIHFAQLLCGSLLPVL